MKKAVLAGCPGLVNDAGRLLIHRYIETHPEDTFDVMDADASMSPYEMSRRINACDGLIVAAPQTLAGLPFALQFFMRSTVYMMRRELPAVFFIYTPLAQGKMTETAMQQLSSWSEKAGIQDNGHFGIGRIAELNRHPESSLKAGWLRPLGQCFVQADEALKGEKREVYTELWCVSGMYKTDCLHYYQNQAKANGVSNEEFRGEAKYVHYL